MSKLRAVSGCSTVAEKDMYDLLGAKRRTLMAATRRGASSRCWGSSILMMLITLLVVVVVRIAKADDRYDDFVQQVVSEDQEHYNDYHSSTSKMEEEEQEMLRKREEEEQLLREKQQQEKAQAEQERLAAAEQAQNDKIQKEREVAFEAELARMSEEKRKAAMKQKKRDAAVARRVLKAAQAGNHYAVLGLRNNRQLRIPGRSITIIPGYFSLTIPECKLFYVSNKQIKKAFREMAKTVHPDKSKDGRAVEAFLAVESAASTLMDEDARAEYDQQVLLQRRARRAKVTGIVGSGLERGARVAIKVLGMGRIILGPFFLPVLILALLIF